MPRSFSVLVCVLFALWVGGCRSKPPPSDGRADAGAATPTHGTKLGFRLSDADPEKPEARVAVKGEPLSSEETARLLARAPALEPSSAEKKTFALHPASLPPPRPGQTIEASFPPPATDAKPPPVSSPAAGALRVARHAPEGEIGIAPNVSITFSEPMVELTTVSGLARKDVPVKLTPAVGGEWRWLGTQTLVFQPERELPKATEFVLEVPAGAKSVSGAKLEKSERYTFATPAPKLVASFPDATDVSIDPVMFAELDQRIDAPSLVAHMHVLGDGHDFGARLATEKELAADEDVTLRVRDAEKKGKARAIAFKAQRPLPPATTITVELPAGAASAEGPRKTKAAQTFTFKTFRKLQLENVGCNSEPRCPPDGVGVTFSTELDEASFDLVGKQSITVRPDVADLTIRQNGPSVTLYGKWKPHPWHARGPQ